MKDVEIVDEWRDRVLKESRERFVVKQIKDDMVNFLVEYRMIKIYKYYAYIILGFLCSVVIVFLIGV